MGVHPFSGFPEGRCGHVCDTPGGIRSHVQHPGTTPGNRGNECADYEIRGLPFIVILGETPPDLGDVDAFPAAFMVRDGNFHVAEGLIIPESVADPAGDQGERLVLSDDVHELLGVALLHPSGSIEPDQLYLPVFRGQFLDLGDALRPEVFIE